MIDKILSQHSMLAYEDIECNGPPSHSLKFPSAALRRATWISGLIHDKRTDSVASSSHILLSTKSRSGHNTIPEQAYWVRKKISETAHGCIRICTVLVRKKREKIRNLLVPDEFARPGWSYNDNGSKNVQSKSDYGSEKKTDSVEWIWEVTDEFVAVKLSSWIKYKKLKGIQAEDPLREISGMQLVGNYHPNILGCVEAMHDEKFLYLVTPFCKNGDFYGRVQEKFSDGFYKVDEKDSRFWFRQILLALLHLQKKGVCHNDICLENILINGKTCKLIDFGLCLRLPYSDPNNEGCVTDVSADTSRLLMIDKGLYGSNLQYLAPELISKVGYFDGFATDLWSVGIILYIMLTGHAPFKWAHESDKNFVAMMNGDLELMLKQANIILSRDAIDLLNKMLQRDPRRRLTLAQVMTHPWVVHKDIDTKPDETKMPMSNLTNLPWFSINDCRKF